ncbi:MAG: glycosyltransferase family 2 protein [Opitutaceae bacterium]
MTGFALVTPSFNQAPYLPACLESVQSQSGVEVNHGVWDGGSRDGSVEVLRTWPRPLRWRSGPDGGQVAAINSGLQSLKGEICGYLNSDDVLLPGALEAVAREFEADPELDVLYGRAWFVDSAGQRTREYPTLPYEFRHLVQHCFLCQPATFWRRRMHERHGWFDPSFDATFDYEFWLRLASRGARFRHLPVFLAESREHPATKSSRLRRDIFAEIRRMQLRHLGYCGRNWWEQTLRYWRDESGHPLGALLPGRRDQRMYRLAWWPYLLWRRKWGGPLFYRPGDWRA